MHRICCLCRAFASFLACVFLAGCQTNSERLRSLAATSDFLIVKIERVVTPSNGSTNVLSESGTTGHAVRYVAFDLENRVGLILPDSSNVLPCKSRWTIEQIPHRPRREPFSSEWEDLGDRSELMGRQVMSLHPPTRSPLRPRIIISHAGRTWAFAGWPGRFILSSELQSTTVPCHTWDTMYWIGLVDEAPTIVRSVSNCSGGSSLISPDGLRAVWAVMREITPKKGQLLSPPNSGHNDISPRATQEHAMVYADISGSVARVAEMTPAIPTTESLGAWPGWIHRDVARNTAISTIPLPDSGK